MYAFQSESTLYICLNVKELLARSRRDIWNLIDRNGTRTHNNLIRKQKQKWMSETKVIRVFCIILEDSYLD